MKKHKHKWQLEKVMRKMPSGQEVARFICECGAYKVVELKEEIE